MRTTKLEFKFTIDGVRHTLYLQVDPKGVFVWLTQDVKMTVPEFYSVTEMSEESMTGFFRDYVNGDNVNTIRLAFCYLSGYVGDTTERGMRFQEFANAVLDAHEIIRTEKIR